MIQLLQPIWLWAGCAIAVPIIIHLWNVRPGRTLQVGNISLFTASAKALARSLKLSEILLLVLRCLLLLILSLLLTQPYRTEQLDLSKEKGWVLVPKESLSEGYRKNKRIIDSLLQQGFQLHYFNSGFEKTDLKEALTSENISTKPGNRSWWTLLKELDQQVPANLPLYVFTNNRLSHFEGSRPYIAANLNWITYAASDSVSTWVHAAFENSGDSLELVLAKSNEHGTWYTAENLSNVSLPGIKGISRSADRSSVIYTNQSAASSIPVDTSTYQIYIYADRFASDANYLKAALEAIREFTRRKIKTTVVTDTRNIPAKFDWLFWLSENDVPRNLVNGKVFLYEKGKIKKINSTLVFPETGSSSHAAIPLFKTVESTSRINEYSLWKNGYGEPILSVEKNNDSIFHFYNRFNPQWNNLVWSSGFPQVLFYLVFNQQHSKDSASQIDKRIVDKNQILPTIVDQSKLLPKQKLSSRTDLSLLLWIIAFVLLVVERAVAYRRTKIKT